jgi:hypothetical protein
MLLILCKVPITEEAFGSSPSFSVREITDKSSDWIDINNMHRNGDPSTDILKANYLSDGSTLNATLWLAAPVNKILNNTNIVKYGMLISTDPSKATGVRGFDYQVEVRWQNGSWTRTFTQWSSTGEARVLTEHLYKHDYTGFYGPNSSYVILYSDLKAMGFPTKYNVVFYAGERNKESSKWIYDFTNVIQIPTAELTISSIPRSLVMRRGEEKNIEIMTTGKDLGNQLVSLSIQNGTSDIKAALIPEMFLLSSNSLAISNLHLKVSENATINPFTLHILANSSHESKSLPVSLSSTVTSLEIPALLKSENITGSSDLMVTVIPPLTFGGQLDNFVGTWVTPVSGLSSIAAVIVTISFLIRRRIITSSGLLMKTYKKRIDDANHSYKNKEEALQHLDEIRMEINEILNKGKIGYKKYRTLNETIDRHIKETNTR